MEVEDCHCNATALTGQLTSNRFWFVFVIIIIIVIVIIIIVIVITTIVIATAMQPLWPVNWLSLDSDLLTFFWIYQNTLIFRIYQNTLILRLGYNIANNMNVEIELGLIVAVEKLPKRSPSEMHLLLKHLYWLRLDILLIWC